MTPRLRVLDLFSGTQSITKAFRNSGHDVVSLDMDPRGAPTICANILDWQYKTLPRGALYSRLGELPVRTIFSRPQQGLDTAGSVNG